MNDIYDDMMLFIVGPLHLYVKKTSGKEILMAFEQVRRYVEVAARTLDEQEKTSKGP
jgi:hypothetical protein